MVHVAILAGGSKKSYILRQPKCFLDLPTGECVVEEILREIDPLKAIDDIVIVAPPEGIGKLTSRNVQKRFHQKIILVPQGKSLQDNLILAKEACLRANRITGSRGEKLGLLYLWGDTPFRKRCAVEEFLSQIDTAKDLIISWVDEARVAKYYALFKKPMIPIWMGNRPGNFKETNMAYLNPDKIVGNLARRFYTLRHTGRLKTLLRLRRLLLKVGGRRFVSILQWGAVARAWHRTFRKFTPRSIHTPRILYRKLDKDYFAKVMEESFGIRADIALSRFPDGFIDLDSKADYKKIYEHFFALRLAIARDCKKSLTEKT